MLQLRRLLAGVAALIAVLLPVTVLAAISASVAGGVLTITLSAADDAAVTCAGGQVKVNGANPSPGPAASCSAIGRITVQGSGDFANTIDLRAVTQAAGFTGLVRQGTSLSDLPSYTIDVEAGGGDDTVFASEDTALSGVHISQEINGGAGSDALIAGVRSTQFEFSDTGAAEIDTVTVAGTDATFKLDFDGVGTAVTVDLNGGLGGDPLAIATHLNRVVRMADIAQTTRMRVIETGSGDDVITMFATVVPFDLFVFPGFFANDGPNTIIGGPSDETYGFVSGVNTLTDSTGENRLSFCASTADITVDLSGGLGGGLIATSNDASITVQLANPGDSATIDAITEVRGGKGNDLLIGDDRNNVFTDCGGNDVMRGGQGNDVFDETEVTPVTASRYATGNDRYEGGPGDDVYSFDCNGQVGVVTDTVVELAGEGTRDRLDFNTATECQGGIALEADLTSDAPIATVGPSGGAARLVVQTGAAGQAAQFENVTATALAGDVIVGNAAANQIQAGDGDLVAGGPGNDVFGGHSTVTYAFAPGPVTVDMRIGRAFGDGTDVICGFATDSEAIDGCEGFGGGTQNTARQVIGSPFADVMAGDLLFGGVGVILSGAGGDDLMLSFAGDALHGDEGNDTFYVGPVGTATGGDDNDFFYATGTTGTLDGNDGDDTFVLIGGLRTVNGGAGNDTFDTRSERPDTINCGPGVDFVRSEEFDTVALDCETANPGPTPGVPDPTDLALLSCGTTATTFHAASADGATVLLSTAAALSPADVDTATDLYVKTGDQLALVSGGIGNVVPSFDRMSLDGTRIIFTTNEAIPGTGDGDALFDVYQWQNGVRTLLTPGTTEDVFVHGTSADATRVFFSTNQTLVPADTDANADLYERSGGAYTLVSGPGTTANAPGSTFLGLVSEDGTHVFFVTTKRLLPADTDDALDVYERSAMGLRRVSGPSLGGFGGVFVIPVAATPSGSHIYFFSDTPMVPEDDISPFAASSLDLYVSGPNGLALIGPPGTTASPLGVTPDGARVLLVTRRALVAGDTDLSMDVYAFENDTFTLLSGGTEELDIRNPRASADGSRVIFETDEALLPADTDPVADLYEWASGTLTLLTGGSDDVPAVFKYANPDLSRVVFSSAEVLDAADIDLSIDLYARTAGGIELVAAGSDARTTLFRGSSADASIVFFETTEALLPGDADATSDLYVNGGTFPADPVCEVIVTEDCDNCVDDDGDLLVDRDDGGCPERADGAGAGLADAKLQGKPAVACQKALASAGAKHAGATLKRLQKCGAALFACLQLKPGDVACVTKAARTCQKQLAGRLKDRTKVAKVAGKKCGEPKVAATDLAAATGLAFDAEVGTCLPYGGGSLATAADVAGCLTLQHECQSEALAAQEAPRLFELMAAASLDPAIATPCLTRVADGGGTDLGDPKELGKPVAKCHAGLGKAAAKLVARKQKVLQKCAATVAACIQLKPGEAACLTKAGSKCGKAVTALAHPAKGLEAKLTAAVRKSCGAPKVALGDVLGTRGIGFAESAVECAGLGVPALATLDDVASCVVRLHECRAEQLLELQTPRLRELLAIGGVVLP